MAGPIRTRQSCDRCHGQKLKCPKRPGSAVCARCEKAGSGCTFSPPGSNAAQGQEHADTNAPLQAALATGFTSTEASNGIDGGMSGMDWSFLHSGFDGLNQLPMDMTGSSFPLAGTIEALQTTGKEPGTQAAFPTPPLEDTPGTNSQKPVTPDEPKSVCVKQLSKVTLELDAIWSALSPRSHLHMPFDGLVEKTTARLSKQFSHDQLLQNFFGTVQSLIDVYPTATKLSLALCPEDLTCHDPACIHSLPIPTPLGPLDEYVEARNLPSTIDLALGNLLLSCHLRVLDVLDRILSLVISCSKITINSPHLKEPNYNVPLLKIGDFTPTRDASAFLQAFLMKHLVERLGAAAKRLGTEVAEKAQDVGSKETKLFSMQCEVLLERQETKIQQLQVVGDHLLEWGMLK